MLFKFILAIIKFTIFIEKKTLRFNISDTILDLFISVSLILSIILKI